MAISARRQAMRELERIVNINIQERQDLRYKIELTIEAYLDDPEETKADNLIDLIGQHCKAAKAVRIAEKVRRDSN